LTAVDGVDLRIDPGEIVGLVGESGSGKTTTGLLLLRLLDPDAGSIVFDGIDMMSLGSRQLRMLRRRMQIVFQDPASALNPRMSVGALVGEPLKVHEIARGARLRGKVARLLEEVGLPPSAADRRPHEFSGGQRQRIAIARALAVRPDLVVCDEPVSALDVSVQAQIVNLLVHLQRRHGMAYLFIAHDLSLVQHLCERVVVMYLGAVVEEAPARELGRDPRHPYTRALYEAVPKARPGRSGPGPGGDHARALAGAERASGCRFRDRCPWAVRLCEEESPGLAEIGPDHRVACHRAEELEEATGGFPDLTAGRPAEEEAR
jgi:peptide/nickel transport system ATP-binding protein